MSNLDLILAGSEEPLLRGKIKNKKNSSSSVEIVIPIYKEILTNKENALIKTSVRLLEDYSTTFFCPQGLNIDFYCNQFPKAKFKFFDAVSFSSVKAYSRLLMTKEFYGSFSDKVFLLIVQPDVLLLRDDLQYWLESPFDYVGAPWPNGLKLSIRMKRFMVGADGLPMTAYVGNGGFSLRRISKCLNLLDEHKDVADWFLASGSNEDLFFAFMGLLSKDFVMPNQVTASLFAMEMAPEHFYQLNGLRLPMGIHAYGEYSPDFWKAHLTTDQLGILTGET